ncbi:hypothetical protein [Sulfurimonas sp.]|uniref:hypothetical protein n=1 Tax=Sulfurimonas sp. TaxID=2022749 RepID=UPI0025DDD0BD|nr:hypothetical protein [Sulfurimonas sp.]MBW6487505.1 hypothetical protein [Sulfurimonas sp.]
MSCCTIKKEISSSIKELDILKSKFDEVVLENMQEYRLLTLRDKANRSNYDWIVWLEVKIPYASKSSGYGSSWSDNDYLKGVCGSICDWVEILKNFEKSDKGKQLSLFEDDSEEEFEKEPEMPSGESGNWNKYFKDCYNVRRRNLMKQYSFFELCDFTIAWYSYKEPWVVDSWRKQLPKSNKEMIELVKDAIIKGTTTDEGHGRFDDFWWDDEYGYMTCDGALSNIELINRVKSLIRLYLVPYTSYFHVSTDLSCSHWIFEEQTRYRYWFDGKKIQGSSWSGEKDLPSYELYDLEFIDWLRNHFNISYKDVVSDEHVLKQNLRHFFSSILWYAKDEYDYEAKINTFKDWKQFKSDIFSFLKKKDIDKSNGGGSGYSIDGFSSSYDLCSKGSIVVRQNRDLRITLNRAMDESTLDDYGYVEVFNLQGDEIYGEAFRVFKKETIKQTSLFDFMAA